MDTNDAVLWYPESWEEIQFITQTFPSQMYQTGTKNFSAHWGFTFADGTNSPGIYLSTSGSDFTAQLTITEDDLMQETNCLTMESTGFMSHQVACPSTIGICKRRISKT